MNQQEANNTIPITWTTELDTGINVIDQQHRRIVDYINALELANQAVGAVKATMIDIATERREKKEEGGWLRRYSRR